MILGSKSIIRLLTDNLIKYRVSVNISALDVVFISQPLNYALENEALYLFNQNPQFFVHNQKEVNNSFVFIFKHLLS